METTKLTLKLDVPMTIEKELEIHREISKVLNEIKAIEVQKARIKGLRERADALNMSVELQTVEADVDCEEWEDIETGLVKKKRLDTGEIFATRPMDPEERQVKLKIAGKSFDEIQAMIGDLNKTEEQVVASTPEEAEELRNQRLLQEQRDRDAEPPTMPKVGDEIEVLPTGDTEWVRVKVEEVTDSNFGAVLGGEDLIWDISQYGRGWRHPPTWSDIVEASAEKERLAEIAKLAGEQAADAAKSPKAILKAPAGYKKGKAAAKKNKILDQDDKPILPAEPTEPEIGCFEDCAEEHEHREPRVAF